VIVDVVTIFPQWFSGPLGVALLQRATRQGALTVRLHDLRQWTHDVHRTVDDSPYGGGPGMVMRPEPWWEGLTALDVRQPGTRVVVPAPAGRPLTQALAADLATAERLVFCCGRYEGIDARVISHWATDEVSLGDYVLAGGEVAAAVILEAVVRLLPGVLGNADSARDDSFGADGSSGLLEPPVYTRPESFQGYDVPPVLLSGDHAAIAAWRLHSSAERTRERRPDLLADGITPRLAE
jgi:tRNA (guanine37-N1)-methyltransferase